MEDSTVMEGFHAIEDNTEINEYFKVNYNKDTSIFNIWEAHKAVLRGNLMYLNSKDKRQIQQKIETLQQKLKQKEGELKR